MIIRLQIVGAAVALVLTACSTQQPRTEAERQQQGAEARADSAREVADTHKAANKEVQKANEALREAEDEVEERNVKAQESRAREAEARTRAAGAPAAARDRIRTAEAESQHRIERRDYDTLVSESARYNCIAAADAKLEQDSARQR